MTLNPARTYPWSHKFTGGSIHYKNIYSGSFGYTNHSKKIASASATAVMAATNGATTVVTVTSSLTDPDVPRNLTVTPGGTTADIRDSIVRVNGTNVEGKVISEDFRFADQTASAVTGVKAFRTVTSVVIGQQGSVNPTFSVGTGNKIGLNHRLFNQNSTVKVYTSSAAYGALTLQNQPTVVANEENLERNTCQPATVPNGSLIFNIFYYFDDWSLANTVTDDPEYSTTTSTSSTSSSTSSTTITTSTSSTSVSSTSSSLSTSTSSTSTSSTSTSTTTTP